MLPPGELLPSFAVAPGKMRLKVGDTATVHPKVTGKNNRAVNPRSIKWVSTNAAAADVNAEGVVTATAVGETMVIARSGNLTDTTFVAVDAGEQRLRVSPDSLVLNWLGETTGLTAAMDDGTGTLTPVAVKWQSLSPDVVQIDSMGTATARAVGTALLIATSVCCGQADTASARVQQLAATLTVEPQAATVQLGSTLQLLPAARDGGDTPMDAMDVTWKSSNEAVAQVSSTGLVTPVAAGTATIEASSNGQVGQSVLTVTTTAAPVPSRQIPLRLHRLDGSTGSVRVSSGVLLQPGQLLASGIGAVSVTVGNTEVPAYVEALHGRHPDGSVVSVLIQFNADPTTQPEATLRLGTAPQQPRLAKQTVDFRPGATLSNVKEKGYPAVFAVPPVSHMTVAFEMFGPTISVAEAHAMGGAYSTFETDFVEWSKRKWDQYDAGRAIGANFYDRGYHHFGWAHRAGDPEFFRRGAAYTFNYRLHYYEANAYAIANEHMWMIEGMALHYWLTGDEESRNAVRRLAGRAYGTNGDSWNWTRMRMCNYKGEARPVARALSAMTWAQRLGYRDTDWRAATLGYVDLIANSAQWGRDPANYRFGAWIFTHPDYPTGAGCSVEYVSNFMNAMILDALITVYDHIHPDPRIPGMIKRNLDYLRKTQWRGSEGNGAQLVNGERSPSFNYYDVHLAGSGGPGASVDLNGFYVHVFAWYGRFSGDQTYWNIAQQTFETLSKNPKDGKSAPWLTGEKQFNETYQKAWQIGGYRR
jgi:hypothetical protein